MAKQKRVFEIAKEIGVDSKVIVAKCHAEGIEESVIKNYQSAVSAGLEATIREWFSDHASASTAIETAEKIDISTAKKATPKKRKKAEGETEDNGGGIAVASPPETTRPAHAPSHAPTSPAEESVAKPRPIHAVAKPAAPLAPEPEQNAQTAAAGQIAQVAKTPVSPGAKPKSPDAHRTDGRTEGDSGSGGTSAPHASTATQTPQSPHTPPQPHTPHAPQAPHAPQHGHPPAPPRVLGPTRVQPAPVNVPTRPTNIVAGPQLGAKTPVKLSGPKVVRIEAAEVMDAPRPRRFSPGGGTGTGTRPAGGEDDGGRSPRRKSTGGGSSNSSSGAAGAKRSSGTGVPQRRRASSGQEWVGGTSGVFSEQDLIEREARLARSGGFLKKRRQDLKRTEHHADADMQPEGKIRIAAPFTIKDLSEVTGVKGAEIVKKLFLEGIMATINSGIDPAKAQEIMIDFDVDLEVTEAKSAEEVVSSQFADRVATDVRPRGPIVTILGHVDHGKTSLLDKIRNANVAAGEAGGITQRTSAFRVELEVAGEKKEVVFLDTPGHEAFTSMRSRGANMTDVVVLVVSAPEGVMPQTVESINHAKAAKVPIVVALNKIDRPDATEAQIQKVLGRLAENDLNPVEWGGSVEVIKTSATTGAGIAELLETLDYQAQLLELKADFGGAAHGTVIEARTEEGRGAVANILVQQGKLKVGDYIVAGRAFGRIRDITDDRSRKIKEATPPTPVQISGIDEVPTAGDKFYVVDSLKKAQEAAEQRRHRERETELAQPKLTLDNMFAQMADADIKEIRVVIKAAEQGTLDVLKSQAEKVSTPEVKVRVLESAIGGITESNVLLAQASQAVIIGFNVIPSGKARSLAEQKGVEIRTYQVIYDIVDDLKKAAEGMLAPELRQEILGHAEVRKVFKVTKVGSIAGCYITDGIVQRDALIRVTRNGVVVENDRKLEQLKRVKDDAKEVRAGMECGMKIVGYDDIKEGDVLECYKQVEVKRTLG
ncbi:MAG: translation initiation factor IF-2 [Phycisphaerales bacterium]|nr:translation initiation factor IF-2 [Phycisphaerales bacterium]